MFTQRKTNGKTMARWVLNATLLVGLILSTAHTRQPQHFQSFHTELSLISRDAQTSPVVYSLFTGQNEEVDNRCLLNSFVYIERHYSTYIITKLKQAQINFLAVQVDPFLSNQFVHSKSEEDHFISLRG